MGVSESFRLDGRTAVVTGGAGLYGTHIVRALAEAGATVALTSRDRATAERAAGMFTAEGLDVFGAPLDQADEDSVDALGRMLQQSRPSVDILINNAVHRQGTTLTDTRAEDWAATSRVNSLGLFLLTKRIAAVMCKQGSGSIVNISSIYGLVAPDFAIYEGTEMTMPAFYSYDKAGMIGFTRYLAAALGPSGVRVNCLAPGGLEGGQAGPFHTAYERRTPLGRLASGTDIAGPVVFLASDAASYVNGAVLPVDGGWAVK